LASSRSSGTRAGFSVQEKIRRSFGPILLATWPAGHSEHRPHRFVGLAELAGDGPRPFPRRAVHDLGPTLRRRARTFGTRGVPGAATCAQLPVSVEEGEQGAERRHLSRAMCPCRFRNLYPHMATAATMRRLRCPLVPTTIVRGHRLAGPCA